MRPSPYRKREILQGANDAKIYARAMPANARAILVERASLAGRTSLRSPSDFGVAPGGQDCAIDPDAPVARLQVAEENDGARILTLPWTRPSPYRKARDPPGSK
jgi:hypothetical protein